MRGEAAGSGRRIVPRLEDERVNLPRDVDVNYPSPFFHTPLPRRHGTEEREPREFDVALVDAETFRTRLARQRFTRLGERVAATPLGERPAIAWRHEALDSKVDAEVLALEDGTVIGHAPGWGLEELERD